LETSLKKWTLHKDTYLTEKTLQTIGEEWKECGLENELLITLFNLWKEVQSENGIWKPELAQKAVDSATNTASAVARIKNIPVCSLLAKMLNMVHNYYWSWRNK
jgi:hypothetical protein